jgi:hypothetical protein
LPRAASRAGPPGGCGGRIRCAGAAGRRVMPAPYKSRSTALAAVPATRQFASSPTMHSPGGTVSRFAATDERILRQGRDGYLSRTGCCSAVGPKGPCYRRRCLAAARLAYLTVAKPAAWPGKRMPALCLECRWHGIAEALIAGSARFGVSVLATGNGGQEGKQDGRHGEGDMRAHGQDGRALGTRQIITG